MRVWPFIPQREFNEVLEWKTDILQGKGAEQRLSLRGLPRQRLGFAHLLDVRQANAARALVTEAGHETMLVPLWMYIRRLGALAPGVTVVPVDTDNEEYVTGGQAVIWEDEWTFEVVGIALADGGEITLSSATIGLYQDAYVCPLREFRLSQGVDLPRGTDPWSKAQAYFESTGTVALAAPEAAASYLGHDVLESRPVILGDMSDRLVREVETVDSSLGLVVVHPTLNYLNSTSQMGWDTLSREELSELRRWLYSRRGKQVGFWMPSWEPDLILVSNIDPLTTELTVQEIGYATAYTVRDIEVVSTAGAVHRLRVLSGSASIGGTEVLTLGAPAGFTLLASEVERISFMDFARLDTDRVEIRHRAARGASVLVPIAKVPAP